MAGKKVVLFGAEKMAQLCRFFLGKDSSYEVVAFTVDGDYVDADESMGLPLVPFEEVEQAYPPEKYAMFIAVGYEKGNRLRADKYREAKQKGYELITHVSSKAIIWGEVALGDNCWISENSVIYPWTTIGNNVIVRSSVYIGHDVFIGDHCWLSALSSMNGSVAIEPYCFIGSNVTIRDKVTIGRECIIGAGSVILTDAEEKGVYVQNPTERYRLDSDRFVQIMKI